MIETIQLHHEDWDFERIFGELAGRGVKKVRLVIPQEWREDQRELVGRVEQLLASAKKAGVEISGMEGRVEVKNTISENGEDREEIDRGDEIKNIKKDKEEIGRRDEVKKRQDQEKTRRENRRILDSPGQKPSRRNLWIAGGLACGLTVVIAGGIAVSSLALSGRLGRSGGSDGKEGGRSSEILLSPSPTASPTPVVGIERGDLAVRVLNGSGVAGSAQEAADFLTELGYRVVEVGNADRNDFESSVLRLKPSAIVYQELFTLDVSGTYEVEVGETLADSDGAGAELVVGRK